MRQALAVALSLLFVAATLPAQAPPQMPKPGPEQKRIAYFAGKWNFEGDMKPSLFGPGGKITSTDNNEWFPGGFFLVMHTDLMSPMGPGKSLSIMGHNAEEKLYTYYAIDNTGMADYSKGTVTGDTWTWTSESKMGGKTVKAHFFIKELSPTSYTVKFEMSTDGGPLTTVMEGKAAKAK